MARRGERSGPGGAKGVRSPARLRPAATRAELASDPHGRWISGPGFVYAWVTPELSFTALLGAPSRDDVGRLADLYRLELAPPAVPHASVIDCTGMERVDAGAFDVLAAYVEQTRAEMQRWITRLAIVRPAGFVGALAAGFYEAIDPPYPVQVFDALEPAFEWTGTPLERLAELQAIVRAQLGEPELLRDLRRIVDARLPELDVEGCASALGVSVRTLQRRLRAEGTTFRRELSRAQVEAAQRRLARTADPVSQIAYEVGFSTPQHLATAFRAATGMTPSAWRARERDDD